jgi:hypothetical protein
MRAPFFPGFSVRRRLKPVAVEDCAAKEKQFRNANPWSPAPETHFSKGYVQRFK